MLGQEEEWQLTNRELAQRLGVDPGHLHFHVRMLLKAGLIELAEDEAQGREKPYRAVARELRVHPDLLASSGAAEAQASFIEEVRRSLTEFGESGRFRTVQAAVRIDPDRVFEVVNDSIGRLLDE